MTTLSQIVTDALREGNVIGVGMSPDGAESAEAFRRLQAIIKSLFGYELGEQLETADYDDVSSYYFVPSNLRLILDVTEAETVVLNPNPRDGARLGIIDQGGNLATVPVTLDANGRKIETQNSIVLNTNGLVRDWFYRADLGTWVRVTELEQTDESPFPAEFDDFLITLLAMRLNKRYGVADGLEADIMRRMRSLFRARYRQSYEQSVEDGLLRLSNDYVYWSYDGFDRGN
jgi:hypothetical protein